MSKGNMTRATDQIRCKEIRKKQYHFVFQRIADQLGLKLEVRFDYKKEEKNILGDEETRM